MCAGDISDLKAEPRIDLCDVQMDGMLARTSLVQANDCMDPR